jgi:adenylosuccinate lyase
MSKEKLTPGSAISPIDGRYASKTEGLQDVFSEKALMRARTIVEVEYLISLSKIAKIIRALTPHEISVLHKIYKDFSEEDFLKIREFEKTTNHDVKAVEYFIQDKLKDTSMEDLTRFVHIGRTSEDINNLAYALMLRSGTKVLVASYFEVKNAIHSMADLYEKTPLLARTHGQPASPTTFGRQMEIFVNRMDEDLSLFVNGEFNLLVKCNGATGGDNALNVAFPEVDWRNFSESFIRHLSKVEFTTGDMHSLKFRVNKMTTQIEPHDTYRRLFDLFKGLNVILIDFSRDIWSYISNEILVQAAVAGEIGSSAMPQKVNPIQFENAEGNLGLANALFEFFGSKLPISRLQRDLSDSTVERNFGMAYGYTLVALRSLVVGIKRVHFNYDYASLELEENWNIISEAYQVILRANGVDGAYEMLLQETRGKKIKKRDMHVFVERIFKEGLISADVREKMLSVTPQNYIGKV